MLRAGFSRFVVDPGVRQAYFPDTARQLYTKKARCTVWRPQMSATEGARCCPCVHCHRGHSVVANDHPTEDDVGCSLLLCGWVASDGLPQRRIA